MRQLLGEQRDRRRFAALLSLFDGHLHACTIGEFTKAGAFENGDVYEHILAAIFRDDEAEAFLRIEPL